MFVYKSEIRPFLITLFLVTLAFGFNDGSESFVFSLWFSNFISVLIASVIVICFMILGFKLMARRYGFGAEFSLSLIKRYGLAPYSKFPKRFKFLGKRREIKGLAWGTILSPIITLISNGRLPFIPLSTYNLVFEKASRFGRKFVQVTDIEEAKIALAGPLANVLLVLVLSIFNWSGTFDKIIIISAVFVLFHMIPFADLPGTKIYFGSRLLYIFSLVFMLAFYGSILFLHPLLTIILSILFAIILAIVYYYFSYYR